MATFDPPREIVPIFNPVDWLPFGDDPLTVAEGDQRYLKLTGGVEKGSVTFNQGLTSQQPVSINQTLSGVANPILNLTSNSDDAPGVYIDLYKNSQTPAVGDRCGVLTFQGNDSNLDKKEYARFRSRILDPTAGSRDGEIDLFVANNDVMTSVLQIQPTQTNIQNSLNVSQNLTVDNGTLYVDSANDRIGIGTTTPLARLSIRTPDPATNFALFDFRNPSNFGIYATTDNIINRGNTIRFRASDFNLGTPADRDVLTMRPEGRVGIGTNTPTESLDVVGNIQVSGICRLLDDVYINNKDIRFRPVPDFQHFIGYRSSFAGLNIDGPVLSGFSGGVLGTTQNVVQNWIARWGVNSFDVNRPLNINGINVLELAQSGFLWRSRSSAADNDWRSVTFGNGLFVAVSNSGTGNRVMTSPDGINWTTRTSAVDSGWWDVAFGNGLFVAVAFSGTGNRVMTSPDGIAWTGRNASSANQWYGVAYGNGTWVAVSPNAGVNDVMTSTDGFTWTSRSSGIANNWISVGFGNGLFVAVSFSGTGNRVMTSTDGITWTSRTSAVDNNWTYVSYGNGLWVAVADSGTGNRIMTSPDGITWTARTSPADNNWQDVKYANNLWVAVASSGTGNRIMWSRQGINWTLGENPQGVDNNWSGLAYGNNRWVAVSTSGTGNRVMSSP